MADPKPYPTDHSSIPIRSNCSLPPPRFPSEDVVVVVARKLHASAVAGNYQSQLVLIEMMDVAENLAELLIERQKMILENPSLFSDD